MGTVAKNSTAQLIPSAEPAALRDLLDGSASRIRVADFDGSGHVSQFVMLVVLLPVHGKGRTSHSMVAAQDVGGGNDEGAKLLPFFDKPFGVQPKVRYGENDLAFGDVKVTFSSMEAQRNGETVILTGLEFKTLKYFAQNPRRVISRDELLNEVWGYENYPCTRTVDNHILKLRQKLEKHPSRPVHFRTVHGIGYKFTP
jgi:hypothetical protein